MLKVFIVAASILIDEKEIDLFDESLIENVRKSSPFYIGRLVNLPMR